MNSIDNIKEKLEQPIITTLVTDNPIGRFCLEYSPVADYISLLERYNILVDYINMKTGEDKDKIKEISISRWQKANSYWARCSLDYPFADDEDIKKAYMSNVDFEQKDIYDKILKLKEERISELKCGKIYQIEYKNSSSNESFNNTSNYSNSSSSNNNFNNGQLRALEYKNKNLQKEVVEYKNKAIELENKNKELTKKNEDYLTIIDYFRYRLTNSFRMFDILKKEHSDILPKKEEFYVEMTDSLKNRVMSLSTELKKKFHINI